MKIRINCILGMIGIAVALAGCKDADSTNIVADINCLDGSKFESVRHNTLYNHNVSYYTIIDSTGATIALVPVALCIVRYRKNQ